jgi:endonuclease III
VASFGITTKKTRDEKVETIFPNFIDKYSSPHIVIKINDQELENDLKCLVLYRQRVLTLKKISE